LQNIEGGNGRFYMLVCPEYPRKVFGRALELQAAALVFAHNRPSADPRPSDNDLLITRDWC
jgi:DNA repair protein RadC